MYLTDGWGNISVLLHTETATLSECNLGSYYSYYGPFGIVIAIAIVFSSLIIERCGGTRSSLVSGYGDAGYCN